MIVYGSIFLFIYLLTFVDTIKSGKQGRLYIIASILIVLALFSGLRYGIGADYWGYESYFHRGVIGSNDVEIGYELLMVGFSNLIPSFKAFNLFLNALIFIILYKALKKLVELSNEEIWKLKRDRSVRAIGRVFKYLAMVPLPSSMQPDHTIEKNYAYFQDFIPQNDSDIRVIVIGERAFAIKRAVREGDFRASGSGKTIYKKDEIPEVTVQKTFELNKKLKTQSLAADWIYDNVKKEYSLVEISYAFARKVYLSCPGYWDSGLNWIEGGFYPEYFMIEDLLNELGDSTR
jgi:hypothetical protein